LPNCGRWNVDERFVAVDVLEPPMLEPMLEDDLFEKLELLPMILLLPSELLLFRSGSAVESSSKMK
jgi:hypothetical protein